MTSARRTLDRMTVRVAFEPRDLWVGVYWKRTREGMQWDRWDVYVCLLPALPIRVTWYR